MRALYHITHVQNLPSILQVSGLLCDGAVCQLGVGHVNIAYSHIKERRARKRVPVVPGGTLADYVPFYFAPRSPMLYAIHKGFVPGYDGGQASILHLVSSAESVARHGYAFVFTDGHAEMAISSFFTELAHLNQIDWKVMQATYWNDTMEDGDRKRRRQAEFLVHQFLPWSLLTEIGVASQQVASQVRKLLVSSTHRPLVTVHRDWYY